MPGAAPMAAPPPPVLSPAQRSELVSQVYKQMEYYFSMENLLKDVHLRKHMTDEGWVPISLVAGFKKMQNMTMDMNIVMEAITSTQFFETNAPNNTHLRIRNDWQRWILAPQQPGQAAPALAAAPPPQPAIRSNP
jgi:la-related protein 1